MKRIILVCILVGLAASARLDHLYLPPNSAGAGHFGPSSVPFQGPAGVRSSGLNNVPILRFASQNEGEGTYRYNYETGNGISAEEHGDARGAGTKAQGSFAYTSPEGERVSVSYTANENGFVPQGSHIPTPPPIPEEILKSLQENAAAEARGIFDNGQYRGDGLSDGQYRGEGLAQGSYQSGSGIRFGTGFRPGAGSGAYAGNGGYRY